MTDAQGVVSFQDNTITQAHDYGYQLLVSSEAGDELVGEAWLAAPTGVGDTPSAAMALRVPANPVVGPLAISYTVSGNAPARVEMFDVRGQRVLSRAVNATGSSTNRLAIGDAKDYASGVYFLRLTQSGHSVSSRFVIVR